MTTTMTMPKPTAEQPLWRLVTSLPVGAREALGVPRHINQGVALGRAPSRAAFVRKLIAAGVSWGSEASVGREVGNFGGRSWNADDLAAVTDDRLYLARLDGRRDRYVPWPPPEVAHDPCEDGCDPADVTAVDAHDDVCGRCGRVGPNSAP